jgi:hypothetical protein
MDMFVANYPDGIDVAFEHAKQWSKYCKEILNFLQRRVHMETEHAKQLTKIADAVKILVHDGVGREGYNFIFLYKKGGHLPTCQLDEMVLIYEDLQKNVPLKNVFLDNFQTEIDFAAKCEETMKMLYEVKCVKRLDRVRLEQDKKRKALREEWDKHVKQYVSCNKFNS